MNTIPQTDCRVAVIIACWALLGVVTAARAAEPKQQFLAEQVPFSVLSEPAPTNAASGSGTLNTIDGETAACAMQEPAREHTAGDRWEEFDAEFGIHKKDPSLIKGSLESAKYRLDETVFFVNEFVHDVENRLSFDYELRSLGQASNSSESSRTASSSPIPLWDAVENAHLKSDIDLDTARGHAFVGVRLVLPIGD